MARDPNERYRTARRWPTTRALPDRPIVAWRTPTGGAAPAAILAAPSTCSVAGAAALVLVAVVVLAAFLETDRGRRFAEQKEGEAVEALAARRRAG
ncbi:MAG: hypothetical protein R3B09_15570 [Nannocystaceae bacterium]